ncbi:MAG: C39 family peptidase [Candidatus Dormibacteraeota bacterium]|nr:C39 family peptidase [Candidatus Dormibacteraeota bacterium]
MAGSLMLSPVRSQPVAPARPAAQTLAFTGAQVAISRLRHGLDLEAPATPAEIYEQYVPPAPAPAPAAGPLAAAPIVWAPSAGTVTIPVPIYRQTRNLNCETAAMQMGLAYYDHYYSQDALFAYENPDLRRAQWINGVLHWGDPYTNFVGDVNGSETALSGYGVYYPVILAIARSHGVPNAYGGEGFSPATVYAELAAGHPVQIWMEARWSRPAMHSWIAWDGRSIRYSQAEHSVILTGVSPTSVRVNDDQFGSQYWVSKWTFETSWRDFNNMAVIYK